MNSTKKLLAGILSVVMIICLFAVPVSATGVTVKESISVSNVTVQDKKMDVFFTIPEGLTNVSGIEFSLCLPDGFAVSSVTSALTSQNWTLDPNLTTGHYILAINDQEGPFTSFLESVLTPEGGKYKIATLSLNVTAQQANNLTASVTVIDVTTGESTAHTNDDSNSLTFNYGETAPEAKNISTATVSVSGATYTGSALKPAVTVTLGGTTLKKDTDYTVAYSKNINVGTATVTVTGKGNYTGSASKTFKISAKKVTPTVTGAKNKVYTGKALTQSLTVKAGTTKLTTASYTVTYKNNKALGKASAIVTLKGNYSGTKTVYFIITPKKMGTPKLTAAKKKLTVKWTKASGASGYQIQYATKSSFKSAKTVSASSSSASKAIKLKAKTKYYVRIRSYKTVSSKKYYGAWSSSKSAKTK